MECCCSATLSDTRRRADTTWSAADRRGRVLCRLSNRFRMRYQVAPGLYAVGRATPDSPVLVSANYKLSFDHLRTSLAGLDAWLLVLDTRGINVWCAAGKGTFGTRELVDRIVSTKLREVVAHRRLVVPQLGAVGIASHEVKAATGFSVTYGPVYARNIPAFLSSGCVATSAMRRTRFTLVDRLVLTPMEVVPALKSYLWLALAVLVVFGLYPRGVLFAPAVAQGWPFLALGLVAVLAGAFLTPLLLPWLPFRAFALKGWLAGLGCVGLFHLTAAPALLTDPFAAAGAYLLFPALSSYLAVNFTGCTTFTSRSGVKRELRLALPLYLAAAALALLAVGAYKLRIMGLV